MSEKPKHRVLTEYEAKQLLVKHKIPVTKEELAKNKEQAVKAAKKIGFPVVMKIVSPDIVHKTEAKGVIINIKTESEVEQAFEQLVKNARAYKRNAVINGVLVQETAIGKELIIGTSTDPQFGPVLMFGIGGIFVEVMKDVTFRVIPITKADAEEMLSELKSRSVLDGFRGEKPLNKNAIINILLKVSDFVEKNQKVRELDINPLFVNETEAKAADARIILE